MKNGISNSTVLLATTDSGLVRAEHGANGGWSVASLLEGEPLRCIASVPQQPRTLYAGTRGHGVLRSDDWGQTWQPAGMANQIVTSLATSPHDPGVLYAGVKPAGVFVSRDGGASWTELEAFRQIRGRRFWRSPAEPPDWRAYVQALSISPTDQNVLMAGIEFGAVVRSQDGGKTWSNHRNGAIRDCHGLTFHATDGDWVYQAGASLVGAAVSRDGGVSWRQPKKGLKHHYGWACAADPERPEVWYLSAGPFGWKGEPQAHKDGQANAAIYRSAGGAPWERLNGGLPQPMTHLAYALVTDPAAPGHLYAGLSSGEVWTSTDYGDSWAKLPFSLGRFHGKMILI
ncbi:MAG TPA: hypothetical protein VLY63_21395 [Anaerolineae bacterium]|nr:hypothetical protein [Anaerolineae bacterium]